MLSPIKGSWLLLNLVTAKYTETVINIIRIDLIKVLSGVFIDPADFFVFKNKDIKS